MNVLFVPDYSGGNPYQRELAAALERRGVCVSMAIPGVAKMPFAAAVREHGLPNVLHVHWIYPFLLGRYRIVTIVKGTRLLLELIVLKLLGVGVVWTVHNLTDHGDRTPRLELVFRSVFARLCDQLIVHCPAAREAVIKTYGLPNRYRDRIAVAKHGHYLDSYPNELPADAARRDLGVDPAATTFLYFGRIREYKNLPGLIDAFSSHDLAAVELLVVGRPADRHIDATIAARCAAVDRVTYEPGFVPEDEVQRYMNAADVVVTPFREVLSSGSAILAMSFAKPVIAPRLGCVESLLDGQPELTFDPEDDRGLVDALTAATTADLGAIGERNRHRLTRDHDWDDIAARTHTAYRRATGEEGRQDRRRAMPVIDGFDPPDG